MKNGVLQLGQMAALSARYLLARPLSSLLNLLMLALGLAAMTVLLVLAVQLDRAFERDLRGIDVVVGAKGSPLQLILAGVFHLDVPPGNIPWAEAKALAQHPQVEQLIPLSLGDSFRGFRIVGTQPSYLTHYGAMLAQGQLWQRPLQVVAGSRAARDTGLTVGQQFVGSHGLGGGGHAHGERPFTVVGVLAPCACVLDRLLLTATESVWAVHDLAMDLDEDDLKALEDERDITIALIRYRTPLAAVTFPRWVNTTTKLQAAAPALEITRLLHMVSVGTDVLKAFAGVLLCSAGLSVFIALWSAVRERRSDLALLRMLGASPWRVAGLLWFEALWLALAASLLGLVLGHAALGAMGLMLDQAQSVSLSPWAWVPEEAWVPVLALVVATLAALVPAWSAYRVDVASLFYAQVTN